MRVLLWHVHGSWTTAFVQGRHDYLVPVLPDRGPDGRGRARTWDWPASVREVTPEQLAAGGEARPGVVVLQRPHEAALLREWTGLRAGVDVPAVYVEHDSPREHAARSRHPLLDLDGQLGARLPVVHVTHFNALMWDCGDLPTRVVEHGVVDPGHLATGERASLAVVVNEPVRRWRVAGTDLVVDLARRVPLDVYGMGMDALQRCAPHLAGHLHEDLPQARMHAEVARHRAYLHPYRWTSLGLALVEAMTMGLPVLALATTAAPESVPPEAGFLSTDPAALERTAQRWLDDPAEARERGLAAREHALRRFGLARFLADWDDVLGGAGVQQ
ncbi:glycosyltransferase family 4 protein [Streptomyces sp. NP160]|uniref:glycosyltransferase n=1 Tax=Streptomyces sp. NP160 TaxID=2586637 RepID=UPI00111BA993|nr:glycosyltransferase [Streptomyces sp. NP160]TNM67213.1 glycosyltransferase family 4 protein [Streptomyces sp. NP160]